MKKICRFFFIKISRNDYVGYRERDRRCCTIYKLGYWSLRFSRQGRRRRRHRRQSLSSPSLSSLSESSYKIRIARRFPFNIYSSAVRNVEIENRRIFPTVDNRLNLFIFSFSSTLNARSPFTSSVSNKKENIYIYTNLYSNNIHIVSFFFFFFF